MKPTSNGFSHYAKIITDEEIDELSSKVETKIIEASDKVINAMESMMDETKNNTKGTNKNKKKA